MKMLCLLLMLFWLNCLSLQNGGVYNFNQMDVLEIDDRVEATVIGGDDDDGALIDFFKERGLLPNADKNASSLQEPGLVLIQAVKEGGDDSNGKGQSEDFALEAGNGEVQNEDFAPEAPKPPFSDEHYFEICSDPLSTEVDLDVWTQGTLASGSSTGAVSKPIVTCRWLLKMPELVGELMPDAYYFSNSTMTTIIATTPNLANGRVKIHKRLQIDFSQNFNIFPVSLPTEEGYYDEEEVDFDYAPPCYYNYLNISYYDIETNTNQELISQFCGDGEIPKLLTEPGRSVVIEANLQQPFHWFSLNFTVVPDSEEYDKEPTRKPSECSKSYHQCQDASRRCIPMSYICDTNVDCPLGDDESGCTAEHLRARTTSINNACGADRYHTGVSGSISSPRFPKNYANDDRCLWYIKTASKTKILIKFHSVFAIEAGDPTVADDCPYDSITFYAHHDDTGDSETRLSFLGRRCGRQAPRPFITPGNKIFVLFESDSGNSGAGFRFVWQAISNERAAYLSGTTPSPEVVPPLPKPTRPPNHQTVAKIAACRTQGGLLITEERGVIRSPGFGYGHYPSASKCQWNIRPPIPHGKVLKGIEIRFYVINIQGSGSCKKDAVEIVFYDHKGKRRRGTYCDSSKPTIGEALFAEARREVRILFRSDYRTQARGFELGYSVILENKHRRRRVKERRPKQLVEQCGVTPFRPPAYRSSNELVNRVVGGKMSRPGHWPFVAELVFKGHHYCGASILNNEWLLTAAHCFRSGRRHKNGWQIVIGRQSLRSRYAWDGRSAIIYPLIQHIFVHRQNCRVKNPKAYDIALVKLGQKLDIENSFVRPACLPSRDTTANDRCYVVGWGTTKQTGQEGYLNQAYLPIIDNASCKRMNFYYQTLINNEMLCAGYEAGGTDSCQGDSGGPLACYVHGKWEVHGIVSFGKGCAGVRAPGVYTRVFSHLGWIQKVIKAFS